MPPPFGPPPSGPLTVLIVGAGIGGLSAAVALRRAGHNVHLFEQSKFANEVGAAIHLGPNASRVMASYGYSEERLGGVPCQHMEILRADGTLLHSMDNNYIPKTYGAPWYLCHRVDLHNELKYLAFDPDVIPGTPCTLHLSTKVNDIDPEAGTLTLADGSVVNGDLIIGADGIHSIIRQKLLPDTSPATSTGYSAFRFIIPVDVIRADPEIAHFAPDLEQFTMRIAMDADGERRIVMYPCRRGELLNFVCIHPDSALEGTKSTEGWDITSNPALLGAVYASFSPLFHRIFALIPSATLKLWQLKDRGPLPTWIRSRSCLLGDACHPMMPHQGQGGGQAIEDGAALGVLFPLGIAPADVPGRLTLYEHVRKARAESIQWFSKTVVMGKEATMKVSPALVYAFTFGHNVTAYAKESLTAVFVP